MTSRKILELEERNEQLKRLVELSVTLNSTLDLDALLQQITDTATQLLDCEAASILLFDEKHPRLFFEGFYQTEPPNIRHFGGLGVGLTIAKGLIEAQGGKIWAESEGEGKGSTFKVLLPKA